MPPDIYTRRVGKQAPVPPEWQPYIELNAAYYRKENA
jgi:hypothetical protein